VTRAVALIGRSSAVLAVAAALGFSACGGTEEPTDTPITISVTRAPDHLDPALASSPEALESLWLVYTPLLTYRHEEGDAGAELIPGLASDLPEISEDGLTYELDLRKDMAYPDGTEVRASDFEHAIERVRDLQSPGGRYYEGITDIDADDDSGHITITLAAPDPEFVDALALPYAAPVPERTPVHDLSADPPPGVGPYEIATVEPDGGFVLKRDPTFQDLDIPDVPTGNVVEIRATVDPSLERQAQDVLDGKVDYMYDAPPAAMEPTIDEQASDRYAVTPTAATGYFALDTRLPPFDDQLVREAVNTGLGRRDLARYVGMQPGCALLAPGVPGYDRELDTTGCPYGDPGQPPDLEAARALLKQAGAMGAPVTVSAGTTAAERAATRAYVGNLGAIGLDPRLERCASCAQTMLSGADPDFPRPAGFMDLQPYSNDPFVASELDRLAASDELDPAAGDWKALDSYVVSPPQSYVAVLGHPTIPTFFSERMDPGSAVVHPVFGNDYSSWQLKEGE
jgi:peptide/nickel transport system substrate-binding protein